MSMFVAAVSALLECFVVVQEIISHPPTHLLTDDEKTLIWSFRYYLTQDNKVHGGCINVLELLYAANNP